MSTPIIVLVKNEEGEKVIAQYVSTDTGNLSNANDDRSFFGCCLSLCENESTERNCQSFCYSSFAV